ncbi:MAG TPA: sulfotransferase, partial [Pirellulales bacterium]|nr:sulfotransferase [Pirellulales bacterium]
LLLHQAKQPQNSATPSCGKAARKKTASVAPNTRKPNLEKPVIKRIVVLNRSIPPRDCLAFLDAPAIEQIARQHIQRLTGLAAGRASRIVDKMPDNYMYLGFIAVLFPRAVLIHCRRNFRDIAVSNWMTDFRRIKWANDAGHIATRIHQYERLMNHWRATLPVPVVDVDYEETVSNLEVVARRVVAACGLDWEPACLDFHRNERPIRTASLIQVRQPIYTQSVGRWKNYECTLGELFEQLPDECATVHDSRH